MKLVLTLALYLTNTLQTQHFSVNFEEKINIMKFFEAYPFTNQSEGLYSNKPLTIDPGGETVFGISRVFHPNLDIWAIVDQYKLKNNFPSNLLQNKKLLAKVEVFYYVEFWLKVRCQEIQDDRIQLHLYDCAINCGQGTAVMMLQECLNVAKNGLFGSITLKAYEESDKNNLLKMFVKKREEHYLKIVAKKPAKKVNLQGWLNRINNCTEYAINISKNRYGS